MKFTIELWDFTPEDRAILARLAAKPQNLFTHDEAVGNPKDIKAFTAMNQLILWGLVVMYWQTPSKPPMLGISVVGLRIHEILVRKGQD